MHHKDIYEPINSNESEDDDNIDVMNSCRTEERERFSDSKRRDANSETNSELVETEEERKKCHARILLTFDLHKQRLEILLTGSTISQVTLFLNANRHGLRYCKS